jgi:hypothetical protein
MKVYVCGNPDLDLDNRPFLVAKKFKDFPNLDFEFINPNEDLNLNPQKQAIIMDTIFGLEKITLLSNSDLDKLIPPPRTTAHDYDLGFQLKYLQKINQLPPITIVGLPPTGPLDYDLIHSIFKKLVAQDIHGS